MRFSLQDIKKQIHRRKGELAVSLHFLRPGECQDEIERLIAYHERLLGQPQRAFSRDEARACVGDYRLADCLIATLSMWYSWQQPSWESLMQNYGDASAVLLEIENITTPTHLRLALFSYVNDHYQGFVDSATRSSVLETFAADYQLSVAQLEYLLALDSEEEAVLVRETAQPPSVQDVATLYNQWAFEAALFNASSVSFVIDCAAFEQQSESGSGVGAVIKRLTYLARKRGVYYDISYDNDEGQRPGYSGSLRLRLTLYGPQEMTGAAQQYGLRLAQMCRMLLGYRRKTDAGAFPAMLPAKAILEAEATIHFLQRAYNFAITSNVLALLPPLSANSETATEQGATTVLEPAPSSVSTIFDSSIEHFFAGTFASLESSSAVDGWSLVREPEPLLLESSIFIPDFALTRNARRIYMEILGFWTPSYRERKVQKLQQLQDRGDIALAIPIEAREAFTAIAQHFPIVYYHGQLSATDILHMLRTHFDDFAQRLASIDSDAVRQQVAREGWIPERTCYPLLHCYRRSELAQAARRVVGNGDDTAGLAFTPGIGLYTLDWLEHLQVSFVEWLGKMGVVPLADILPACRTRWPQFATTEDATLEALFSLWPEVQVKRSSIFDATIALEGAEDAGNIKDTPEEAILYQAATKKTIRERKTSYKKHSKTETQQGDLWG